MLTRRKIVLISLIAIVIPFAAQAADISVVADQSAVLINQPVRVDVTLDTQGDDVNAIQAEVDFPSKQFSLRSINDGASPFSFWIQPPAETASGVVSFSGIIPGGFQGSASSIVSLWLTPLASGSGTVVVNNIQLLKNDGQATPLTVTVAPVTITVGSGVASGTHSPQVSFITPDPFTPVISQDPNLFGGKYFLAFSTTDKGSGIDRYEVLEGVNSWRAATSPYEIQDQSLSSDIYVRAVDHAGNFIVVKVPARYPGAMRVFEGSSDRELIVLAFILLIMLLFARAFIKRKMLR